MTDPSRTGVFRRFLQGGTVASVWAAPATVLLIIGAILTWSAYEDHDKTLEQEYRFLDAHARIAEARLTGLLRQVDQMLERIAIDRMAASGEGLREFEAGLPGRLSSLPEIRTLLVTDATGYMEMSSNPKVKGVDASGRGYFTAHAHGALGASLFISRPFVAVIGRTTITVSRAMVDADQGFRGVVGAGMDPQIFDAVLRSVMPEEEDSASAIFTRDGDLIYRLPAAAEAPGEGVTTSGPFDAYYGSAARAFRYVGSSSIDRNKRVFAFRRVGDTNLSVNVSRRLDDVLVGWRRDTAARFLVFAFAAAIIVFLARVDQRTQTELLAGKAFTEQLIETANVMVVGLDAMGRVMIFNEAAERGSGYNRQEVLGRGWFDLVVPRERYPQVWEAFQDVRSAADFPRTFENPIVTKSGEERIIAWQNSRIFERGVMATSISFGIDVTERRKADQAIRDLNAHLEERVRDRTAKLEHALKDMGAFSYSISHDLRAPLRAINGYAQILVTDEQDKLSEDGRQMLSRIASKATYLGKLIDDVLEYSRVGNLPANPQAVDFAALARTVAESMRESYPGTAIEVMEVPSVHGDSTMLRQVLENLIGNACKFSAGRERPAVEIGSCGRDGETVFYVRDSGAGFDMRYSERLFGMFQRMHGANDFSGTGVGLAIVKRLIDHHHGRIWAEAVPDRGATFYFTLAA